MIVKLVSIFAVAQLAVAQDFPITFKDGMIGVNFGGYHAEAGLGGLLTGNAAHGGLIASAGTPSGQSAVAGLGGNSGPNQRGGLFAGATAGEGVGASASLAGDVNNGGSFGVGQADAYAGGVRKEVIKTVSTTNVIANGEPTVVGGTTADVAPVSTIPTQSDQFVSEVDQTETQSENSNIPTSTPGSQYIPPKKIHQSDQSSDSDQLKPSNGSDQSSDSDQLKPVKKIEQSDQSSDSDQLEPSNGSDQSSDSDQLEPTNGSDQSSDSDQFEPENPEKSQPTTKKSQPTTKKSQIQSTTTLAPKTTVGAPAYVPTAPAPAPAPVPASVGVSTDTRIDSDDDDLSDNIVPQTVQHTVIRPAGVNVQKIKVRPQTQYTTVYQKQIVPAYYTKTYSYQPQVFETAPIHQYQYPVYQPVVFQKRIQIGAPQIAQRVETVERVETTPRTTTTSTTPRPPYVYTYDKQKALNEIISIPFHALRAVSDIINAKLAGGLSVQKTISYA